MRRFKTYSWTCDAGFSMGLLHERFPHSLVDYAGSFSGGAAKYIQLEKAFGQYGWSSNVLYAVSRNHHEQTGVLVDAARRRDLKFVWNQSGAWFPYAHGLELARRENRRMAALYRRADYVFYQSRFAQAAADRFLGSRDGPGEVLHNAVDTRWFVPVPRAEQGPVVLLVVGSDRDIDRLLLGLDTLAELKRRAAGIYRLRIAGRLSGAVQEQVRRRAADLKLGDAVQVWGSYGMADAPAIYVRADVLLHSSYQDVCPSVVLEAMASGLAVVYSASGGTPELVGHDAGVGIPVEQDWNTGRTLDVKTLADAVMSVAERLPLFQQAARARSLLYDLPAWLDRHAKVLRNLVA